MSKHCVIVVHNKPGRFYEEVSFSGPQELRTKLKLLYIRSDACPYRFDQVQDHNFLTSLPEYKVLDCVAEEGYKVRWMKVLEADRNGEPLLITKYLMEQDLIAAQSALMALA